MGLEEVGRGWRGLDKGNLASWVASFRHNCGRVRNGLFVDSMLQPGERQPGVGQWGSVEQQMGEALRDNIQFGDRLVP